jgi:lipopolysaccharide/colanic/teichoic acid biosynthesis glycosyltransferase
MYYETDVSVFPVEAGRARFEGQTPDRPVHGWYLPCKMAFDWLIALGMLALLWPVILVLALLVKWTSNGPAFYCQTRLGRYGRPYRMYKLRTMVSDSEAETGPTWSAPNDSRVTPLGRVLRDTHLDELPQLWNVVRCEMSLIGPRPERPELVPRIEAAISRYRDRLMVRPGITGLAQMHLPPDTDLEGVRHKLLYDLYYVREVNPWLDTRIGLSTGFHFVGTMLNSVGKMLVRSCRTAVERDMANAVAQGTRIEPTA